MKDTREQISDIIYGRIPVNTTCPHCEAEIDIDSLLIPYKAATPADKRVWEKMVSEILGLVLSSTLKELAEL